jgi:putative membrane protein
MWSSDYGLMGSGFGFLFMLFFWILLIFGIVSVIRWINNQGGNGSKEKTPMEIVKERYARGEINKKEYEEKKRDLA